MPRKLWVRIGISAAVTGALVTGLTFAEIHPHEIAATLARIGPQRALLALLAILVQLVIILTRLWWLFPSPRPRYAHLAHAFSLGEVVNNFVPARVGDAVKVVLVTRGGQRSAAEMVGVLLADTIVNLTALVALVLAVGPGFLLATGDARLVAIGGAIVVAVAILWAARRNARVRGVLAGMRSLRDLPRVVVALVLSVGNWSAEFVALRCLSSALGVTVGYADAVRLLLLFNLGIAFNLSVANVGTFEVPIAIGLSAVGLAFSDGLAVGIAYHALQIAAIGLLALAMVTARRVWPARFGPYPIGYSTESAPMT